MVIDSTHVSNNDLQELLNGDGESPKTKTIGDHLHQCEDCRRALDALAAKSMIWKKTSLLLKEKSTSDSIGNLNPHQQGSLDFPQPKLPADESAWQCSLDQLLDPPKHPEMMGRIGKYDIEREVGCGGMGVVFKAHDAELNRPLAIKILAPHLASHGTARKRFAQEAIAAAGVLHPNVIAVYGVNNEGRTPYIVMPYVAGPSLQALVDQQGPLTEIEIARIALQISSGLAAAHSQGLVHRDIKPANILVEAEVNRVLITDFGLARAEDDASLTRTGWLAGTPNYMSPEQARGERPDQRSDLFSLGSLIYFLASGRLPFRSESPLEILNRIQNDQPTPIRQVNNRISKTLSDVIEKLLSKDPDQRFQTSADLHELLEQHLAYLHQPDISKPPIVNPLLRSGPTSKTKMAIGAVMALGLALVVLAYSGLVTMPDVKTSLLGTSPVTVGDAIDSDKYSASNLASSEPNSPAAGESEFIDSVLAELSGEQDGTHAYLDAMVLYESGKLDESLLAFERSARFEQTKAQSLYNIGCIRAIKGQKEKAFAALNRAVAARFTDLDHYQSDDDLDTLRSDERFRQLITRLEALQQADELLSQAIDIAKARRYVASESLCRQALKLDPGNEKVISNLGYALLMQGRLDEAIPWIEKTAASTEYSALGHYNLSCVSALRNDPGKAYEMLEKAIDFGLAKHVDVDFIEGDSNLDSIRNEERYARAIEKLVSSQGGNQQKFDGRRISDRQGSILVSSDDFEPQFLYNADEVKGVWEGELGKGKLDLQIMRTFPGTDWSWGYSTDFEPGEFSPKITESSTRFSLKRRPGTLDFEGAFSKKAGQGTFIFDGSDSYRKFLVKKGIKNVPDALLFRFFFLLPDEKRVIVNLQALQKLGLDEDTLQVLMVDGSEADLVKSYQEAGLSVDDHLKFVIWRVTPDLLVEYENAGLSLEEHQDFINQRVPPALLKSYLNAGRGLKKHRNFINGRVEPDLLKSYESAGLAIEEYDHYINMRVPAKLLRAYSEAGLDIAENEAFINSRVEAKLVKKYVDAGLDLRKHKDSILQRRDPDELNRDD